MDIQDIRIGDKYWMSEEIHPKGVSKLVKVIKIKNGDCVVQLNSKKRMTISPCWLQPNTPVNRPEWKTNHKFPLVVYEGDKFVGTMATEDDANLVAQAVNNFHTWADEGELRCIKNEKIAMREALIKIMKKTEHDSEIYVIAAEAVAFSE